MANLLGKEAGLFVSSGTQSNLIALMTWTGRGDSVICGDQAHIAWWEQGGMSQIGNIFPFCLPNNSDGTIDLDKIENRLKFTTGDENSVNYHHNITKVVCLENSHCNMNGAVLKMEYIENVRKICDKYEVGLHLDGARMMNAVHMLDMYSESGIQEFSKPFDTISICLSKGIGAPIGSCLVGSKAFIAKARRLRKALGGGMRQAGVLAGAAIYALDNICPKIKDDNKQFFSKRKVTHSQKINFSKFFSIIAVIA